MKSIMAITAASLIATSASAFELGVSMSVDGKQGENSVFVSQQFGSVTGTLGVSGQKDQERVFSSVGYHVLNLGPVAVTPAVGVAYVNNAGAAEGFAATVGLGASIDLHKKLALVADVTKQYGQDRVSQSDGTRASVGLKYRF